MSIIQDLLKQREEIARQAEQKKAEIEQKIAEQTKAEFARLYEEIKLVTEATGSSPEKFIEYFSVRAQKDARKAGKADGSSDKRQNPAAKYQNPANSQEKWTGRGRQPGWVKAALEKGGSLEDLRIR